MSFFEVSEQVANRINSAAQIMTVIGALFALVGTIAAVWSGGIKEQYSNEKIQQNKVQSEVAIAETAKANAETEKAREQIAFLSSKAEQAKLEQERLKAQLAWRRLSEVQYSTIKKEILGNLVSELWVTFVKNDPESNLFREDINSALESSGVKTKYYSGYTMAVGLNIIGPPSKDRDLLIRAFEKAGLVFNVKDENGFSNGQLQVLVGSKPPVYH